jgi:hypothetical protein
MSKPPSKRSIATKAEVLRLLDGDPTPTKLNAALHELAVWRSALLENTLVAQAGSQIQSGPFAGMIYNTLQTDTCRIARLLGSYETTLFPVIAQIVEDAPPLIIDIGCGDGYYAVGLACCLPDTTIWARDADHGALEQCQALADTNNVHNRVKTGGRLTHADFDICRAQPTTILCDIGGAEAALLDPDRAKGLRRANVLVEVHEGKAPGLCDVLVDRFSPTHNIMQLGRQFDSDALPDWMEGFSDMDRLLALWEQRSSPTPWLWMEARHR